MNYCESCGHRLRDGALFCGRCGVSTTQDINPKSLAIKSPAITVAPQVVASALPQVSPPVKAGLPKGRTGKSHWAGLGERQRLVLIALAAAVLGGAVCGLAVSVRYSHSIGAAPPVTNAIPVPLTTDQQRREFAEDQYMLAYPLP